MLYERWKSSGKCRWISRAREQAFGERREKREGHAEAASGHAKERESGAGRLVLQSRLGMVAWEALFAMCCVPGALLILSYSILTHQRNWYGYTPFTDEQKFREIK
jgi:hypothetical protein